MAALQVIGSGTWSDGTSPRETANLVVTSLGLTEKQGESLFSVLNEMDLDPVLIIKPRNTWMPYVNVPAAAILDDIATWEMGPNQRRDYWPEARNWLYHFDSVSDIVSCRYYIRYAHPYAFGLTENQVALGARGIPACAVFADTMIVNKIAIRKDDVFPYPFFTQ